MQAFELAQLLEERARRGERYLEFIRVPALSMGLYALPAFSRDHQQPHHEDEVYYVAGGRALIRVGEEEREVGPGSIVYIPAEVEHRFHDIAEDLTVLVFFAPAETRAQPGGGANGEQG